MDRPGRVREVFAAFLRLGVTSFGGPVAHLGYFRDDLVVRRRWVDDREYADLVALCQFLPGPASSQVGFALGLRRAGVWGALAAFAAFTLPSAVLLTVFAAGASLLGGPVAEGMLAGLKIAAVAIVAHAVVGMVRTLTPDARRAGIAVAAAAAALLVPGAFGQVGAIALGIVAGLLLLPRPLGDDGVAVARFGVRRGVGVGCLVLVVVLLVGAGHLDADPQVGVASELRSDQGARGAASWRGRAPLHRLWPLRRRTRSHGDGGVQLQEPPTRPDPHRLAG